MDDDPRFIPPPFRSIESLVAEMEAGDEAAALREIEYAAGTERLRIYGRRGAARGNLAGSLVGPNTLILAPEFHHQTIQRGGDGRLVLSSDPQPSDRECWRDLNTPDEDARKFLEARRRRRETPSSVIEACPISAAATEQEESDKAPPRDTVPRPKVKRWLTNYIKEDKHVRRADTLKDMLAVPEHHGLSGRGALAIFQEYSRENPKLGLSHKGAKSKRSANN